MSRSGGSGGGRSSGGGRTSGRSRSGGGRSSGGSSSGRSSSRSSFSSKSSGRSSGSSSGRASRSSGGGFLSGGTTSSGRTSGGFSGGGRSSVSSSSCSNENFGYRNGYSGYNSSPYYERSPRRYFPRRRSCLTYFISFFLVIFIIIPAIVSIFVNRDLNRESTAASNTSSSIPSAAASSESMQEPAAGNEGSNRIPLSGEAVLTEWYRDELGWIVNQQTLVDGLDYFYQKTGIQPYIMLLPYDIGMWNEDGSLNSDKAVEYLDQFYSNTFTDEAHFVLCYFSTEYDSRDEMEGQFQFLSGYSVDKVMDSEGIDIFWDCFDQNYYDTSLGLEDMYALSFRAAADTLMK